MFDLKVERINLRHNVIWKFEYAHEASRESLVYIVGDSCDRFKMAHMIPE